MAVQWFYREGTNEIGPLTSGELRSLAKAGTISPSTAIRKATEASWTRSARIKGLFDGVEAEQQSTEVEEEPEGRTRSSL